jgi:SNF2 family DNA or RNA helicase
MRHLSDLHGYQLSGVEHILKHKQCGLFLDMGLGKTVTTLTAINRLIYEELEIQTVLIIAPKRVVESVWDTEAASWSHTKHLRLSKIIGNEKERVRAMRQKADIYLISRDNVVWLTAQFGGSMLPYDMLVIDELSSFKNNRSKRFIALKHVRHSFQRIVGLTGTPTPNGMADLWAQMFLIDGGYRLGRYISAFRDKYLKAVQQRGHVVYKYDTAPGAAESIKGLIGDICISMSAKDYLTLPERIDNVVKLQLPPDVLKRYKAFERDKVLEVMAEEGGKEISAVNAAGLTNKLLQFANGFVYDDAKVPEIIHDVKIDALRDIMEEAQGSPVLVAWTYQADRDRMLKDLKAYKPRELKGNQDIADWNEGKIQLLTMHPASGGHGLNLQAGGNIIVWYGNTWSLELEQQFNARLDRQGQTKAVIIHRLVTEGTVDEDVVEAIRSKDNVQASFLSALKARIDQYIGK